MAYSPFVPLRVFSSYTMLEGAIEPKAIAKAARERGLSGDRDLRPQRAVRRDGVWRCVQGGGGAADHRRAAQRRAAGQRLANGAPQIDWLALYAQDETGYGNLCALVSHAHLGRPVEHGPARHAGRHWRGGPTG